MSLRDEPLFEVDPAEPIELTCSVCTTSIRLSEAGARLKGWRVFHGTSQGGGEVEHSVLCGSCSGRGEQVVPPTWNWRCKSCGAQFSDSYVPVVDPPLLDLNEAWESASTHRCEPQFDFLPPGINKWIPGWDPLILSSLSLPSD